MHIRHTSPGSGLNANLWRQNGLFHVFYARTDRELLQSVQLTMATSTPQRCVGRPRKTADIADGVNEAFEAPLHGTTTYSQCSGSEGTLFWVFPTAFFADTLCSKKVLEESTWKIHQWACSGEDHSPRYGQYLIGDERLSALCLWSSREHVAVQRGGKSLSSTRKCLFLMGRPSPTQILNSSWWSNHVLPQTLGDEPGAPISDTIDNQQQISAITKSVENKGHTIEEVSSRHARRKLQEFSTKAQKALWFAHTFGLIPEILKVMYVWFCIIVSV